MIALPGGAGTASEIKLALRYGKPVLALGRGRGDPAGVRPVDDLEALHGVLEELLEIEGQDVAVDRRRVEPGEERS